MEGGSKMKREKFEHEGNLVVIKTYVKLHEFLKTMNFLNFADDNRKWRLPSREEIVEFTEKYPDKVVDIAYKNDDYGRTRDCMKRWYFTEELSPMREHCSPSHVVVYDLDKKIFEDFYYTDCGILNCQGYGCHNAIMIGEDKNSLQDLEQKAEGGSE